MKSFNSNYLCWNNFKSTIMMKYLSCGEYFLNKKMKMISLLTKIFLICAQTFKNLESNQIPIFNTFFKSSKN